MDDLKNKLILVVSFIFVLNLSLFVFTKFITSKIKAEIISELKGDYSPSPYGPGLNPDKIKNTSQDYLELHFHKAKSGLSEDLISSSKFLENQNAIVWRNDWETDRGF